MMRKKTLFLPLIFTLLTGNTPCAVSAQMQTVHFKNDSIHLAAARRELNELPDQDFAAAVYHTTAGINIPYRLLTPSDAVNGQRYPLVITLHNSSRMGNDNQKQLEPLARLWLKKTVRNRYQAYVLAPQFSTRPVNYYADKARNINVASNSDNLVAVLQLIDSLRQVYPIDENRIYLSGYSMGGSSAIGLLTLRPHFFAAAVAIAPVPQMDSIPALRQVPIWLIHGMHDTDNLFSGSRRFYEEIGPKGHTRFWAVDNATHHNITGSETLSDTIPAWLFRHKLTRTSPDTIVAQSPKDPVLYRTIQHMDSLLFDAFNTRNMAVLQKFFAPEIEFYNDGGGLTTYQKTMDNFKAMFQQNATSGLRRELVPGTLEVYPMPGFGAIETGTHRFIHMENGREEIGVLKFIHIWQLKNNQWQLTRVISLGH